ncbi:DUF4362 domain-containing protein [Evansella tamaricis]|uniref:DUF4362 domain-containing protein n=1 Tax=Evansella tamaricis TaxID=2069301 RepID=A0ABS6JD55_9BACI|nr:DUF4362 domain-containing protein [Evansella tamaricis]MBU9711576.1 DUF4362 domain-containing protein [Evansella tamaricis]
MSKTTHIFSYLVIIVLLAACNTQDNSNPSPNASGESPLTAEGDSDINVKGVKNVDVLNTHGSIEGLERMVRFYGNVKGEVPSDLRVVHYTIEGDPIVTDLSYNGEMIEVKNDTTRDNFGSGSITTNNCGKLIEEVNPTNTTYIATDCIGGFHGMEQILQVYYNMSEQDLFEFELKYGVNQENEINTKTNTLKKESSENGSQLSSDFRIAVDVKQEVYKSLVFANYLAEKDFITTCDTEDAMNYYLKVYINGGVREFQWSACDQSMDGLKFTEIGEYIIDQSEQEQQTQPEVTVQGYVLEKKDNELLIGQGLTMLDYEWIKDELQDINFNHYSFDFTVLEGVQTAEFNPGEKIIATIADKISGKKPGRAKVKEMKKIELQ